MLTVVLVIASVFAPVLVALGFMIGGGGWAMAMLGLDFAFILLVVAVAAFVERPPRVHADYPIIGDGAWPQEHEPRGA